MPGVATARALRARGHGVTLWLAGRATEAAVVADWDGAVERVAVRGAGGRLWGWPGAVLAQIRAVGAIRRRWRRERPDAVLAMGSYASVAPVLAARLLGIPVVLHEANAVPGRAVAWLARLAAAVGIVFPEAARHLPAGRTQLTGLPMRALPVGTERPPEGPFTLLVMGGSQGAQAINRLAPEAVIRLHREGRTLRVIHLAGPADETAVRAAYAAAGVAHQVHGFLGDMGAAYRAAHLAISRAGAGSCMELAHCGVPAILVPLPSARRDHQRRNAESLAAQGGAWVRLQAALTPETLADDLRTLMDDPVRLETMRSAQRQVAVADGAERLAELVGSVLGSWGGPENQEGMKHRKA